MQETFTAKQRSAVMSRIRSRDTSPELAVRRLAHKLGYRFRLHRRSLPGSPDLVFPGRRKVIYVHGCFWHQHTDADCADGRRPASNQGYWDAKLTRTVARDKTNIESVKQLGWDVLVIWGCEVGDTNELEERLRRFLDDHETQTDLSDTEA